MSQIDVFAFIPAGLWPGIIARTDTTDLSEYLQEAVTAAAGNVLSFHSGTFHAAGIVVSSNTILLGVGAIIKAPPGSDGFIVASDAYARNRTYVSAGIRLEGITLDGNKGGGATCDGLVLAGYRCALRDVDIFNCAGHGLIITNIKENGEGFANQALQNKIDHCRVVDCDKHGIYGRDGGSGKLADNFLTNNALGRNGTTSGYRNLYSERTAGWQITGNIIFDGPYGNVHLIAASGAGFVSNQVQDDGVLTAAGEHRSVYIDAGIWPTTITANQFVSTLVAKVNGVSYFLLIVNIDAGSEESLASVAVAGNGFSSVVDYVGHTLSGGSTNPNAAAFVGNTYNGGVVLNPFLDCKGV